MIITIVWSLFRSRTGPRTADIVRQEIRELEALMKGEVDYNVSFWAERFKAIDDIPMG